MQQAVVPVLLFLLCAAALAVGLLVVARMFGPRNTNRVKEMPYESGMDPIHDTRRRFDVGFYLVAIDFLLFDVELLFLYPWAVASFNSAGIDRVVSDGLTSSRGLVFGGVMVFIGLLSVGLVYAWRKGTLQWR